MNDWTIRVRSEGKGPPTAIRIRRFLKALLRKADLRCVEVREEKRDAVIAKPQDGLRMTG